MLITKKLGNRKLIILMIVGAIAVFSFLFILNVKTAQAGKLTCYGEGRSVSCWTDWPCEHMGCSQQCSGGTTVELCAKCRYAKWMCVYGGWWPPVPVCWWTCHSKSPACTYINCADRNYVGGWDYFCKWGRELWRKRWREDWYCSGGACRVHGYGEEQYVRNCGSTTYGGWRYYCSGSRLYRRRTIYHRGCSGSSCYYYTSTQTQYVRNCGGDYWTNDYRCSGQYRQRRYVHRGCSGSSCYSWSEWKNVQDCGTDGWTNEYRCSGNWRQRKYMYRGCSGSSCYANPEWRDVEDCGGDYCDPWSDTYCKNNDVYHKRTCYDKGCSGGNCYNNPWTNEPLVQDCNDATEQCVEGSAWCESRPSASNLSVDQGDYCAVPLHPIFSWTFSDPEGDSQGAYQVQIDNNPGFSSPELDSGKVYSASESYAAPTPLSYNTTYWWRLKVWDEYDAASGWISGPSFTTSPHAWPYPDFSWFPTSPTEDELVQFCSTKQAGVCPEDVSTCYTVGGAIPSPSCSGKAFLWTFPAGTEFATGSSAVSENPRVKFDSTGAKSVSLKITNDVGSCTETKIINIMLPLPKWEEIAP